MFGRIHPQAYLVWWFLCWRVINCWFNFLVDRGLFTLSVSSCVSFDRLYIWRNWSIGYQICGHSTVHNIPLLLFNVDVVCGDVSSFVPDINNLNPLFLSLTRHLLVVSKCSKNHCWLYWFSLQKWDHIMPTDISFSFKQSGTNIFPSPFYSSNWKAFHHIVVPYFTYFPVNGCPVCFQVLKLSQWYREHPWSYTFNALYWYFYGMDFSEVVDFWVICEFYILCMWQCMWILPFGAYCQIALYGGGIYLHFHNSVQMSPFHAPGQNWMLLALKVLVILKGVEKYHVVLIQTIYYF